ncbi:hypothetical protein A2Z61_00280 [Candidatus Campbellbacteria bacterium RIFCSPLOWO2_02_35_12]|uniref:Uncharacterized protein n=1 Tax=Candidatus Campbellbacteria bacterium RIFCSPLOWO2_02_35_12 TaxID=1797580 RepID=A0A1F5EGB8_9BACT|nr:MAG: hypothetical protein A2Z61_00280 [Candidatus Campbellbacteria bacterium RIFCSPLOWO2_02_35_12]
MQDIAEAPRAEHSKKINRFFMRVLQKFVLRKSFVIQRYIAIIVSEISNSQFSLRVRSDSHTVEIRSKFYQLTFFVLRRCNLGYFRIVRKKKK